MTPAKTLWFSSLLVGLMLSGCSLPGLNIPATGEAKLFAEGLDRYILADDPTTLEQLPLQYPQGKWRARAESVLDMIEQQKLNQSLLKKKGAELVSCQANKEVTNEQVNKELTSCLAEKNALVQDNKMLEATLNQLKEVLIDTELKAK